jgi:hypothetical protein
MARKKIGEGVTTTVARPRENTMGSGAVMMAGSYKSSSRGIAPSMTCSAEQIRERAYYIFLERQKTNRTGDSVSDWCQAEHELNGDFDTVA